MEDLFGILNQLVAFPTESRTSNTNLIDYYADRASSLGGHVEIVPGETETTSPSSARANLHVRFGPDVEGGLLLSGHTDVVPAGSGWATDPYQLTPGDDRLFGRGTADMKGFLAAALAVVPDINVGQLERPVHLALSYDEEIGCIGVHHLLDHLDESTTCRPDLIVVGEPTSLQLCTAHSGKRVYQVSITSPSGHSSRSTEQATAIEAAGALVESVFALNETSRHAAGGYSTNVGTIRGGVAVNVLAPSCELDFECRHPSGHDPDELLSPVFQTIDSWAEKLRSIGGDIATIPTISYPALTTSRDAPAVSRLRSALGEPPFGEVSYGCEAGLYTQALPAPAVIYGPGDIADAHRPDEYVLATDLVATSDRLISAIDYFCRGDRQPEAGTPE